MTAAETSMPFMDLLVLWLLGLFTVVLGNVIFHWVLVPLTDWIEERFL